VNPNEFCPRGRALALRRWRYAAAAQNIADGLIRSLVAQIGQSKVFARLDINGSNGPPQRRPRPSLMTFLKAL
jgi:hypothetical protein